jgi:hypothetical protein
VAWRESGSNRAIAENYFLWQGSGFLQLDLRPLAAAAEKAVPEGFLTYAATAVHDLKAMTFRIGIERRGLGVGRKVGCCQGILEVPFRIVDGRAVAAGHVVRKPWMSQ